MQSELKQLQDTRDCISKIYKKINKRWTLTSLDKIEDYIKATEDKYAYQLSRVHSALATMQEKNTQLSSFFLDTNMYV